MSEGCVEQFRFCGVRESVIEDARRREYAWRNKRNLRWYLADRIPGIPLETLVATYAQAFAAWQAVCGLTFERTNSRELADFIVLTRAIDGAGGTLAEHELPPGDDRPVRGWFDTGERWGSEISLLAVATHEFGHGIGLSHEPTQRVTALMDPIYNPRIITPQPWDVAEAVRRYGPPVAMPPEPEPPPGHVEIQCTINGVAYKPTVLIPA